LELAEKLIQEFPSPIFLLAGLIGLVLFFSFGSGYRYCCQKMLLFHAWQWEFPGIQLVASHPVGINIDLYVESLE